MFYIFPRTMAKPFKISMSTKKFDYVARCILVLNDMFLSLIEIFFSFWKDNCNNHPGPGYRCLFLWSEKWSLRNPEQVSQFRSWFWEGSITLFSSLRKSITNLNLRQAPGKLQISQRIESWMEELIFIFTHTHTHIYSSKIQRT